MAMLIEAILAERPIMVSGTAGLMDRILDREEFTCIVPSTFNVVLGFSVYGEVAEQLDVSVDVLGSDGELRWSVKEPYCLGSDRRIEGYTPIPMPVSEAALYYIRLKFDDVEVWRQRIYFAQSSDEADLPSE